MNADPVEAAPGVDRAPTADVRLALGAAAAWSGVALCEGRSAATVLAVAAAGLVVGVFGWAAAARRVLRGAAALGLIGFCLALVLVPLAGRIAHARESPLYALAHQHAAVSIELTVHADPLHLAAKGVAGTARVGVDTRAHWVVASGVRRTVDGAVFVLAPQHGWLDVLPGQRLDIDGILQPSLDARDRSVTLTARSPPRLIGRPPWWQRAAGAVRIDLRRACAGLPASVRGLLPGLIDGDTSGLDPVLGERFRVAGLTHLVAVSGTNCSILTGAVLLVLGRFGVRRWIRALVGALVVVGFVVVARPSPSVLRAAVMAVIALAALASGRPKQAVPALAAAVLVLLLADPALGTDPGFAMSVLATGAIVLVAPGWARALRRRHVPAGLAEALAVAVAAHVVTAPVIAAIAGRVSLVAVPANVLAEPAVAPATVLGFLAALIAPLWLGLAASLAWLASWPTRWLVWDGEFFGSVHGARLPWPAGLRGAVLLVGVSAVVVVLVRRGAARRLLAAATVAALVVQFPVRTLVSGWPPAGWVFTVCDVGQGDALVLAAGPHTAVEVDTGPDPVAVDRCLRDLGVTDIPLLILTHYHLDHVGGLTGALHGRRVGQVLASPLLEPATGVQLVEAALTPRHLTVTTPRPGTTFEVGAVRLDTLGPAAAMHGTRSDPNNSSLVFRATVRGIRILLAGDAEIEEQRDLLDTGADLRADVLKVPHHGSAYSAPEFLAAVHARVAIISVGADNEYGLPSPTLLAALDRLGLTVLRTDQSGDVAVTVRGPPSRVGVVVHGRAASAG